MKLAALAKFLMEGQNFHTLETEGGIKLKFGEVSVKFFNPTSTGLFLHSICTPYLKTVWKVTEVRFPAC